MISAFTSKPGLLSQKKPLFPTIRRVESSSPKPGVAHLDHPQAETGHGQQADQDRNRRPAPAILLDPLVHRSLFPVWPLCSKTVTVSSSRPGYRWLETGSQPGGITAVCPLTWISYPPAALPSGRDPGRPEVLGGHHLRTGPAPLKARSRIFLGVVGGEELLMWVGAVPDRGHLEDRQVGFQIGVERGQGAGGWRSRRRGSSPSPESSSWSATE